MTPENLLTEIARQDPDAFARFFSRFSGDVRRHLARIVRDDVIADDLAQDVFLRVWQRAGQWSGTGAARSWLFTIATNLALNHLRTVKRRREDPLEPTPDPHAEGEETLAPAWMIDEAAIRPDKQFERAERVGMLSDMIDDLSEAKREVMRLVYDAELDVGTVADRLGIPEGTVKSRIHHARRQLTEQMRKIDRTGIRPPAEPGPASRTHHPGQRSR